MNAYVIEVLSRHQLEELRAGAERHSQLREVAPSRPLRVTLGLALIRLGTWTLGPSHRRLARSF